MKTKISEIFKSIQGEGVYQGQEQVFVRFYGCNLKCAFCDTKLDSGNEKTVEEVFGEVSSFDGVTAVSLTGGEPLLNWKFIKLLSPLLSGAALRIHLETNGVLYNNLKEIIACIDVVAMDFKFPSSTKNLEVWKEHKEFLKIARQKEVFIKAVIGKDTTCEDVFESIKIIKELKAEVPFILQPENPFENLLVPKLTHFRDIYKSKGMNVMILPQLHKMLDIK
ncbi:MAG: 7-carboxy-7-deazaguanine synthase QueE [Candidatus Omnitrophota bacterium]